MSLVWSLPVCCWWLCHLYASSTNCRLLSSTARMKRLRRTIRRYAVPAVVNAHIWFPWRNDVAAALSHLEHPNLKINPMDTTYFPRGQHWRMVWVVWIDGDLLCFRACFAKLKVWPHHLTCRPIVWLNWGLKCLYDSLLLNTEETLLCVFWNIEVVRRNIAQNLIKPK